MSSFKDKSGREWTIEMSIGDLKRVRETTGVNLMELTVGEAPPVFEIVNDIDKQLAIVWALIEEQATEAGLTEAQFLKAMNGKAAFDATCALWDQISEFLKGLGRKEAADVIRKTLSLRTETIAVAVDRISKFDVGAEVAKAFAEVDAARSKSGI